MMMRLQFVCLAIVMLFETAFFWMLTFIFLPWSLAVIPIALLITTLAADFWNDRGLWS